MIIRLNGQRPLIQVGLYSCSILYIEVNPMKKRILTLAFAVILLIMTFTPVSAGGDKVRGDNGQGGVVQTQVQDPPPFQD